MSVRATERLIGDIVVASGLSNSPKMIVKSVDIEAKRVTAVWFSDHHEGQEATFPATAIDRVEETEKAAPAAKAGRPGRKPAKNNVSGNK
jgi:hypothetical protein